ncbi:MAG: cyclodeaminase/cyclohydrolase family protein [Eubacteriales bacterium]|nr:cyclodeaminase/cyclohydrolase family protein [Eubacteriales bacterium]
MLTKDKTLLKYTTELGSKLPAPGGGSAAAVSASLGTSLLMMVANLTIGKKNYLEYEARLIEIVEFLTKKYSLFLDLSDKDAEAFIPLSIAYKLPRNTEKEQLLRKSEIEKCLYQAANAPLELMKEIRAVLSYSQKLCEIGSRLAISDVGAGIKLLQAGCDTAYLNVIINTKLMQDKSKASVYDEEALILKNEISDICDKVYKLVCDEIKM